MPPRDNLAARQEAAQVAYAKMVEALIEYSPCGKLTVDDVLYIARTAQGLAFNAMEEVA